MPYVKVDALCAKPGCTRKHHGRSKHCLFHLTKHSYHYDTAPLELAQALLNAPDLPHTLIRSETVMVLNVATGAVSVVMSNSPMLKKISHLAQKM